LADGVEIGGEEERFGAETGGHHRGLGAGMAGADDNHIIIVGHADKSI
jgi:hypothetical protein